MPFSRFALHPDILKGVKEMGFSRPTPIQELAIPPALEGRDVLACATTGSGKSAAFLLPILNHLIGKPRGTTRALVLTPTRELAAQIHMHLEQLSVHTPVSGATVYGGMAMGPQEHAFRSGADVLVATPGRLLDHLRRPYAKLNQLEVLVIDEADRMLDMGFLPDIRRILRMLPSARQTFFFSATMPREIVALAREMLRDPATFNLERKAAPAIGITQAVYPVRRELKPALLLELLKRDVIRDAIVFTRTKHRADRVSAYLEKYGIEATRIHGNRSQSQRTKALDSFKAGKHRILVATDIMARGIDIEELGHVVNLDVPADPDSYIHRVGRTARAEATGDAFTFVSPEEERDLLAIESALGRSLPRVTLSDFEYDRPPGQEVELRFRDTSARPQRERERGRRRRPGAAPPRAASGGARSGSGGAPRGSKNSSRDARVQAILDRHAPLSEAPAAVFGRRGPKRRKG